MFDFDEVLDTHLAEVIASQDAVLLGRTTYDVWSAYWPTSDIQPFADFINTVPKYVATSTPLPGEWPHAEAIDGELGAFVSRLKAGDGGDIGVHGSIRLTQSLLAAGLVDELHLVVAPRVAGSGRRLFEGGDPQSLELLRSVASPSGALVVHYALSGEG